MDGHVGSSVVVKKVDDINQPAAIAREYIGVYGEIKPEAPLPRLPVDANRIQLRIDNEVLPDPPIAAVPMEVEPGGRNRVYPGHHRSIHAAVPALGRGLTSPG